MYIFYIYIYTYYKTIHNFLQGGWGAVCACRVFQGLFQGFFYPSTHAILGKWAPPTERGRLSTYIYAGENSFLTLNNNTIV